MKKEPLEHTVQKLKMQISELRKTLRAAERREMRAKNNVAILRNEIKKSKTPAIKSTPPLLSVQSISTDSKTEKFLGNICQAIEDFDKNSGMMARMSGDKVARYVRSKLTDRLIQSGASIIKDEVSFDLLRHNPVEISDHTEEGCKISETIRPGIEYGGKVYLRAIVKLENV